MTVYSGGVADITAGTLSLSLPLSLSQIHAAASSRHVIVVRVHVENFGPRVITVVIVVVLIDGEVMAGEREKKTHTRAPRGCWPAAACTALLAAGRRAARRRAAEPRARGGGGGGREEARVSRGTRLSRCLACSRCRARISVCMCAREGEGEGAQIELMRRRALSAVCCDRHWNPVRRRGRVIGGRI